MRPRGLVLAGLLAAWAWACVTHGVVFVTGNSMRPALAAGDLAVYRRGENARIGSMAVFARPGDGRLTVHRVIGAGPRGELRTRGDANDSADAAGVPPARVRGQVVFSVSTSRFASGIVPALCYTSQPIAEQWR